MADTSEDERRRHWVDFVIDHEDGSRIQIRSRGFALDGDDLVFFNNWGGQGRAPLGTRIKHRRVKSVTSDGVPRPLNRKDR